MRQRKWLFVSLAVVSLALASSTARSEEESGGSSSFWDKTKVTGQFNTSYNWSFNNPAIGSAALAFDATANNAVRVFDYKHNDFSFNLAEIAIETKANDWAKFRVDIDMGEDVAVVDGTKGGVIGTDEFGLQQAYAELTAPLGSGLTFKLGHFVTQLGYEVIESSANWNTSRSILFGFAIPFTHTGALMTYPFSDSFSVSLGIVNGWDTVSDNNKGKTILAQIWGKPWETLTLSLQGTFGPEQGASDGNLRGIVDFVGTWTPSEVFTLGLNFDLGKEEGIGGAGFANWWGGALYAHYKPFDWFGLTLRGEWFQDDGSRLGLGANTTIGEGTLTSHFYLADGWETRLEFRHDQLDGARGGAFTRSNGTTRKFQDTASVEVVYAF